MKKLVHFACCLYAAVGVAHAELPVGEVSVGLYRLSAEIAHTRDARMTGLMHRTELGADAGMLFVFPSSQVQCMWMRNTLIPLSVAFIDDQGVIINIEDMQPQTETPHCAKRAARYALETRAGWFAARKLGAGVRLGGLERVPAPQ
ncbi:DUF192 domain-containing protein [Methyloversatilis thermotolerans]|uniref:DUF192 domain-containing protein n=1 Tax=Methyloversatilis thermotolerans TaxID=1346290 RepID=UPI00037626C3|nr:DUF192 domain-containing protein [Methyloversatilis thermotolerans]